MSSEVPPAVEAASSNSSRIDELTKRFGEKLSQANQMSNPDGDASAPQAALDWVALGTLLTTLLNAFANCRGGTSSGIHEAKTNTPRTRRLVRARIVDDNYGSLREYRRQGGARVLEASMSLIKDTTPAEFKEAVEEHKNDRQDSGYAFF